MRKADNLPPSCAVVTKSGNRNFLEPSGPFRACNGTAYIYIYIYMRMLLICGFINYAVSMSDCIVEQGRMVREEQRGRRGYILI